LDFHDFHVLPIQFAHEWKFLTATTTTAAKVCESSLQLRRKRKLHKEMANQTRQNFHEDCENGINKQINMELYASYAYLSMVSRDSHSAGAFTIKVSLFKAYYFDRDDVALPGMHWYFKHASDEEREHAMKLLKYLNKRGGRIVLQDIKISDTPKEMTAAEAMEKALELEKQVNEALLELHGIASARNDVNFCDFLETEFLQEQVDAIKEIADHVTNLHRVGEGVGVYIFDKNLHEHGDK